MSEGPGKKYLDRLSSETDFVRDQLEKVYRLVELLGIMSPAPDLEGKLALKGGTAIQLIHMGFRRLSVDVDLNYIGSLEREVMERDRAGIGNMLERIFREKAYEPEPPPQASLPGAV